MNEFLSSVQEVLTRELFAIAGTPINLLTLITFVFVILFSVLMSRLVQKTMTRYFHAKGVDDEGSIGVMTRLAHYMVMAVGVVIGFHVLGINLSTLFAAGAVFAIALGFAMQNIAQNFVSGIILLSERTIKPGDVLEVEGVMVRVQQMGTRSTVARTLDDEDLIIPNMILVGSTVKNFTLKDNHYRIRTVVGVSYGSDMKVVHDTLVKTAEDIEGRSLEKKPTVFMTAFGNSSVDFEVSIWTESPWSARTGRSALNTAIWWALKDAGVTIAFPQMDVHLDPDLSAALAKKT